MTATLHSLRHRRTLTVVQSRLLTESLAIDEAFRAALVETHNPIANDLERDITKTSSIGSRAAVVDRRERQQTSKPGLRPSSAAPDAAGLLHQNLPAKKPQLASDTSGSNQRFTFTQSWEDKRVEISEGPYNWPGCQNA